MRIVWLTHWSILGLVMAAVVPMGCDKATAPPRVAQASPAKTASGKSVSLELFYSNGKSATKLLALDDPAASAKQIRPMLAEAFGKSKEKPVLTHWVLSGSVPMPAEVINAADLPGGRAEINGAILTYADYRFEPPEAGSAVVKLSACLHRSGDAWNLKATFADPETAIDGMVGILTEELQFLHDFPFLARAKGK